MVPHRRPGCRDRLHGTCRGCRGDQAVQALRAACDDAAGPRRPVLPPARGGAGVGGASLADRHRRRADRRARTATPDLRGRASDSAGGGGGVWRRIVPVAAFRRGAARGRGRDRRDRAVYHLLLRAVGQLLALQPALRDGERGDPAGRRARGARPGARRGDVQATGRRARRGRARRADRGLVARAGHQLLGRGRRRDGRGGNGRGRRDAARRHRQPSRLRHRLPRGRARNDGTRFPSRTCSASRRPASRCSTCRASWNARRGAST